MPKVITSVKSTSISALYPPSSAAAGVRGESWEYQSVRVSWEGKDSTITELWEFFS